MLFLFNLIIEVSFEIKNNNSDLFLDYIALKL